MREKRKKMGNVPNLRFPGFEGAWEVKKLGDTGTFFSGGTPLTSKRHYFNGDIPFIRSGELNAKYTEQFISEEGLSNSSAKMIEVGDLIYALYGATSGEVGISKIKGAINQAILCMRTTLNNVFLLNYLRLQKENILNTYLQGGQGNLSAEIIKSISVPIPTQKEQDYMASFLSLIDERIATQSKIVQNLETLIKGLCQNLVGNNKKKNRKKQYLKDILVERKELNFGNYSIHSVSVSKGVINQIEYLGRSFAAKDTSNYNVVDYGDIIYTKSPTGEFPYGIIKQSFIKEKVAVSPLYGVFVPKNIYLANILHYYFKNPVNANNYLHSLIQKGAKNTINITNQSFLDKEIYLPTDEREIKAISNLLNSITQKIVLAESLRDKYTQQKKYLLQNLFI